MLRQFFIFIKYMILNFVAQLSNKRNIMKCLITHFSFLFLILFLSFVFIFLFLKKKKRKKKKHWCECECEFSWLSNSRIRYMCDENHMNCDAIHNTSWSIYLIKLRTTKTKHHKHESSFEYITFLIFIHAHTEIVFNACCAR